MTPESTCPPFASVALDQSVLENEFTYAVPDELRGVLKIGHAVAVPLGGQMARGFVTGFSEQANFDGDVRPINRLLAEEPLFHEKLLKVARWMSAYYHSPLAFCLDCFLPRGWQVSLERRFVLTSQDLHTNLRVMRDLRSQKQAHLIQALLDNAKPHTQKELEKVTGQKLADALKALETAGVITQSEAVEDDGVKARKVQAVRALRQPTDDEWTALGRAPKQADALRKLLESGAEPTVVSDFLRASGADSASLRALEKKGFVEFSQIEIRRAPTPRLPTPDAPRADLTDEQKNAIEVIGAALDAIQNPSPQSPVPSTILLHGVTASGKTEVYLEAISRCLQAGRRALVLVPEIALTAQTVETFQRRFQERVAILHSALGKGERFDEWRRARSGEADIIVGARSAVFAPCDNLGLIIIDEEHDHSYKQDNMPRYHARDVALRRAALENAVVVLGSATPSLESHHRATKGEFGHVQMLHRVPGRGLPEVEIVDVTGEAHHGVLPPLSRRLQEAICETVARGEQVILFLNRRGFSTYVCCLECGHAERCINCDVTLTFHRADGILRCHHCDYQHTVVYECPKCKGTMIGFSGSGTEKVEAEVAELLARRQIEARVLRLDRDTTSQKGAHSRILSEFRHGRAQVLIGTQMVTKGLDFPNVTLVGVILADAALNVPDFRAAERTFQLLAQVSGRAGRGDRPGRVLVQTLTTDHYAITAACAHDYLSFVAKEIEARQSPCYPPFAHLVNMVSSDENPIAAKARIDKLALCLDEEIKRQGGGTELLGPVECPLGRVKNRFRFHLMLRDRNRPRLHRVLAAYDALPREAREGLTVDVDPASIL